MRATVFSLWCISLFLTAPIQARKQTTRSEAPRLDVSYFPTPQPVVDLMLELANVRKTDLLYDLGCGDGRIVVTAGKKYGCKAVGVDIDPNRVEESLANVKAAHLEDLVTIEQRDIFELDLRDVDVVTLYLLPELNTRLIPQLEKMKPGSRIVSHNFAMKGVVPDALVTYAGRSHGEHKIYLWTIPLDKRDPERSGIRWLNPTGRRTGSANAVSNRASYDVFFHVAGVALGMAVVLWLLGKRLGAIKVHVKVDRPGRAIEEKAS